MDQERPEDYSPEQGARFEIHFEKLRNRVDGAGAVPFEAGLEPFTGDGRDGIAGVRVILLLPSSRGRQPWLPMDLRFEKWRRSFASAKVRLGVFGSKPWTMDCFQVTRLRRITKRRFNELVTQARERRRWT